MKIAITSLILSVSFSLTVFGDDRITVGDIVPVIRDALREGATTIETKAGVFVYPGHAHGVTPALSDNPPKGLRVKKWNDKSKVVITKWINDKKPQWVSIIVSHDSPAKDFINLCALLNNLKIGFSIFRSSEIEGWVGAETVLFDGYFNGMRPSNANRRRIVIPRLPVAPEK